MQDKKAGSSAIAWISIGLAAAGALALLALWGPQARVGTCAAAAGGWFIVLAAALIIAGAGWLLVRHGRSDSLGSNGSLEGHACPSCGRFVLDSWRICPHCGRSLDQDEDSVERSFMR